MPLRIEQQPDGTWSGTLTGPLAMSQDGDQLTFGYRDEDECEAATRTLARFEIHRRRGRPDSMPWNRPDNDPDHADNRSAGGRP